MLACAGIDRQHKHKPSWPLGPVGHRGGCDRELHADANRRVYTCWALNRAAGPLWPEWNVIVHLDTLSSAKCRPTWVLKYASPSEMAKLNIGFRRSVCAACVGVGELTKSRGIGWGPGI